MKAMLLSALASALATANAASKTCMNITVPVQINARNGIFNVPIPQDNFDAQAFALAATRRFPANGTAAVTTGYRTISGTFNISAKYCQPTGSRPTAIQVMTHGIGFDKTYWDLAYNNFNYSYINTAIAQGYATLSYDRLGIGMSSHGNPRDVIQSFTEIDALVKMTNMLRDGSFPRVSTQFQKIIHVGHSFGSAQTYAMTAMYPNISDGIVLTGFSLNADYIGLFTAGNNFQQARLNQPLRFGSPGSASQLNSIFQTYGLSDLFAPIDLTTLAAPYDYPPGYLVSSDVEALIYLFLFPTGFDPPIAYFGEAGKQPVTIGEALTLGSLPTVNKFAGPVLVATGVHDVPFCGGQCNHVAGKYKSFPASVQAAFPNAKFSSYVIPNCGHGINFHYVANTAYSKIQSFLSSNGLGA